MDSVLAMHRFHFAFTITFHYLFAQLSMGLALLIFILRTMALRTGRDHYHRAARFWIKIFAISFAVGAIVQTLADETLRPFRPGLAGV